VLLDKTGELLRRDYDWSGEITEFTAPTMLVYGDADAVRPAHIVEFYALLGGGLRDANWETARPARWPGWRSCPATRTMTSPTLLICPPRSFPFLTPTHLPIPLHGAARADRSLTTG
jgi:hypothetical protein